MDLDHYVEHLRHELAVAADAAGEDARAVAERLAAALESATRLVLLSALSGAADEITRELAPGSVDVRLRGLDPQFVVTPAPAEPAFEPAAHEPAPAPSADDGAAARINLRLPEQLKQRVEEAAGKDGLSVNAWLVRAVSTAVEPGDRHRDRGFPSGRQRYQGWVR